MWNYSDIIHVGDGVAVSAAVGVRDTPVTTTTTTTMSNPPSTKHMAVTERTVQPPHRPRRVPEKPQSSRTPPSRNGQRRDSPKEFHSGNSRNGPRDSLKEFHPGNSRNSSRDSRPGNSVRSRSGSSSPLVVKEGGGGESPVDEEGGVEMELPGDLRKEMVK